MTKLTDLKTFDVAEHLDNPQAIAEYLSLALEDDDPAFINVALSDVARAKGMTEVAKQSGTTREALYRALTHDAKPRFDTIQKVFKALGVKLVAVS